ncbi:MAG: hypothetical protein IJ650_00085 [Paludibacteraceae bacterium]|nr:hypothetical protein [Paludibacteraceae bacterium]
MRKYLLCLLLFCYSLVYAQSNALHSFDVTGGVGWSNIGYKLTELQQTGNIGALFHVGYNFHPVSWMSLGVGLDFECDGAMARGNLMRTWNSVTDTDGENYDHSLQLVNWKERQQLCLLQIPVALQFIVPTEKVSVLIQVGAKYAVKIGANVNTNGTTLHTGYYAPWHLTLQDMEQYGFYTADFRSKNQLKTATDGTWHIFAKAGVAVPMTSKLYFIANLYADYSLTNIFKTVDSPAAIGVRNDKEGMQNIHYFMPDYTSVLDTDIANLKNSKLLNVGLELGIRYVLKTTKHSHSHSKKYPCRCLMD